MSDAIRAARQPYKRTLVPRAPLSLSFDDQVLTFRQWCQVNGFSERTGRRILAGDDGPVVTQLSPSRVGVTVANNRAWQASKART